MEKEFCQIGYLLLSIVQNDFSTIYSGLNYKFVQKF